MGSLIIKVQQSEVSTCQSFIVSASSLPLTVSKIKLTSIPKNSDEAIAIHMTVCT